MYRSEFRNIAESAVASAGKTAVEHTSAIARAIEDGSWKWKAGIPAGIAAAGGIYYAGHKNVHRHLADKIGETFGTRQRNNGGGVEYNNYDNGGGYY